MQSTGIPAPPAQSLDDARNDSTAPLAPWPHTVAVLSVLAITTVLGHMRSAERAAEATPGALRYVSTLLLEWLLLGSVIGGIYHRRAFFTRALASRTPTLPQSFGLGTAVYLAGLTAIVLIGGALYFTPLRGHTHEDVVLALLPHTPWQLAVWFAVSLTAGICEEFIFRGYLQPQLIAWTGRPALAIVLTALLFGSVHLYEGLAAILPLAALALIYGVVVHRLRGDLRAVIIAHTLQDFLVALLALARPWAEHYQPRH